jgi:hypothetical protein
MITYVYGDLFTSPARVLVNLVNTVGTMSGDQGEVFRSVYPAMFAQYQRLCEADQLSVGQAFLHRTAHKWILNIAVKRHFRAHVRLDAVELVLQKLATLYAEYGFTSISLNALGVGDGIASLEDVRLLLTSYLGTLPIMVFVHLPADSSLPEARHNITTLSKWLLGRPQTIPFETFWRGVSSLVRRHPQMVTLDGQRPFGLSFRRDETNPRLMSLKIMPEDREAFFMPQSLLRDLWQYVVLAGYVYPANLPHGMETYSAEIVALLSRLSYMRPLKIASQDGPPMIGLHYVPPVERDDPDRIALTTAD